MDFRGDVDSNKEVKPYVNLTSLIDVVLLLLIFFMLTTHFVGNPSISVNLPKSTSKEVRPDANLTLTINRKGKLYLNGKLTQLAKLPSLIQDGLRKYNYKVAVIKADEKVSHGTVIAVMDIIKEAGIERLAIAVEGKT